MAPAARPRYTVEVRHPGGSIEAHEIAATPFTIGREQGNDLVLDDPRSSRRHAQLEIVPDGRIVVRDLDSSNGTFVGERRIGGGAWLSPPASVRVGQTDIEVRTDFVRRDASRDGRLAGPEAALLAARVAGAVGTGTGVVALAIGVVDGAVGLAAISRGGPAIALAGLAAAHVAVGVALLVAARRMGPRADQGSIRWLLVAVGTAAALAALLVAWGAANGTWAGVWLPIVELVLAGTTLAVAARRVRGSE